MDEVESRFEHMIEKVGCPVCGRQVTVAATYRWDQNGEKCLVGFECDVKEECKIPSWDPCPLYVFYSENRLVM